MIINLSAIIQNRPKDADFLKKIEQGYNQQNQFSYDPCKCFPSQLDTQDAHRPPFFGYMPEDKISSMLGTLTTAINSSHNLPLSGLMSVIKNEYPNLTTYFQGQGVDFESINPLMVQTFIKNVHCYENAPIVECTTQLYGMLIRCSDSSIPVSHFRPPYQTVYFDYSDIDVSDRVLIAEKYLVDGCYLHVTTCNSTDDSNVRKRMLNDDVSTRRAIELGFIDENDTNDLYTLLFICHDTQTGKLEEIEFSFVVSRNLDIELSNAIKALQPDEKDVDVNDDVILFSSMSEAVALVANQCLYMISQPLDRTLIKERNELYIALKRTHNVKKKRQIQKKIDGAKDCIRIGKQYYLDRDTDAVRNALTSNKRDAQLRCGHFKTVRYGKGRSETRIVFVMPYWTGEGRLGKSIRVKVQ
ncbi:hypothetical protein [Photobacterium kishitanii]|uniref:Uncharacterized protein n=1 Tax=Photobacterium kishitanii TaxID=318456 RepID=A0A2T3KMG4_9GAMM|nr:hypothetical protein [Photobacterium kishitanii]PSV00997.1 hypothetical protein C9J27_02935 [Photobacterium kishitanii]